VFIDEREDAINWGNFETNMDGFDPNSPAAYGLYDLPAFYHCGSCGFSFADGHAEIHRWKDARTTPPLVKNGLVWNGSSLIPSARNLDVAWLQDHTSRKK